MADEATGAVEGIHEPQILRIVALAPGLLAVEAVVGMARPDDAADHLLGLHVSRSHGARVGFGVDLDILAIVTADDLAGSAGSIQSGLQVRHGRRAQTLGRIV